jgi:hypothetical protein
MLKIAGGVFLGILAAFAMYKAIDTWERQALITRIGEEEAAAARAHEARIVKAAKNLYVLQPNKLKDLCGTPLRELEHNMTQKVYYTGADRHMVFLEFGCAGHCYFRGMHQGDATSSDWDHPKNYEEGWAAGMKHIQPFENQILELPCLIGLADGWQ